MNRILLAGLSAFMLAGAALAEGRTCYTRIYDTMLEFDEATDGQVVKSIMVGLEPQTAEQIAVYIHAETTSGPGSRAFPCQPINWNGVNNCSLRLEYTIMTQGPVQQSVAMSFENGRDVMWLKTGNLGVAHPIYPNDGMDNILIADRKNGVREMTTFKLYKTETEACVYSD